jgi:hypothetical protein
MDANDEAKALGQSLADTRRRKVSTEKARDLPERHLDHALSVQGHYGYRGTSTSVLLSVVQASTISRAIV